MISLPNNKCGFAFTGILLGATFGCSRQDESTSNERAVENVRNEYYLTNLLSNLALPAFKGELLDPVRFADCAKLTIQDGVIIVPTYTKLEPDPNTIYFDFPSDAGLRISLLKTQFNDKQGTACSQYTFEWLLKPLVDSTLRTQTGFSSFTIRFSIVEKHDTLNGCGVVISADPEMKNEATMLANEGLLLGGKIIGQGSIISEDNKPNISAIWRGASFDRKSLTSKLEKIAVPENWQTLPISDLASLLNQAKMLVESRNTKPTNG